MDTYTCIFGLQMVIIFIHTITNIIIVSLLFTSIILELTMPNSAFNAKVPCYGTL